MRKWTIHLFNSSHMDPGWHDLPERIMAQWASNLDTIVEFCEQTRDEPVAGRVVFTIEHALAVDYYERHRSAVQFARFIDCCRSQQIEIGAIYAGVHTDLCGREELARLTSYATSLRRRFGLRIDSAMLNDVSEGYTMGLPQVLAKSGISSLCMGPGVKAVSMGIQPDLPRVFFWRTPDGSQVLACWTPGYWTYTVWSEAGFHDEKTLETFEALGESYPYDRFFRHMGGGDNSAPTLEVLQKIQGYQSHYPDLVFQLSRVDDFAAALLAHDRELIPTFQGDNPSSWADGTLSLARETGLHRASQRTVITAETLATLAQALTVQHDYPAQAITDIYRNLHMYSDHTWGLDLETGLKPGSPLGHAIGEAAMAQTSERLKEEMDVDDPIFDEWRLNWEAKKVYAHEAIASANQLLDEKIRVLTNNIFSQGTQLAVWNTTSWVRSGTVRHPWPPTLTNENLTLIDARDGQSIPWQRELDATGQAFLSFVARDLPALGYVCFALQSQDALHTVRTEQAETGQSIENQFYRVELDAARGTIRSIWDKQLQRELVDLSARYGFNQYIHADVTDDYEGSGTAKKAGIAHGEGTRYLPDVIEEVHRETGPVFSRLRVRARLTQGPAPITLTTTITLEDGSPWVDIANVVDKKASLRKEQIYFAFPFAVKGPLTTTLEEPYAALQWDRDILPACWRGYSSTQYWVDMSGAHDGITWSSLDAPVVCVGDITSNQWEAAWHRHYVPTQGHIYSYVMSNIWNCNYALWQGGEMQFRYRLTSHAGGCDQATATRFGWEHADPVLSASCGEQHGVLPAGSSSLLQLEPANVAVAALKQAEDGDGYIIRIYETGEQRETTCRLTTALLQDRSVVLATLAEEELEALAVEQSSVQFQIKAHELVTLRIR